MQVKFDELHNLLTDEHPSKSKVGIPTSFFATGSVRHVVGATEFLDDEIQSPLLLVRLRVTAHQRL